ncbi:MAG: glycoside hydrolase family 18 protein, partial [Polyangiaceae bacterium]|nr:glycoside hydrolase family 18 protein [Polyangiaceae bacterium]
GGLVEKVHAANKKIVMSLGGDGATSQMAALIGTPAQQTFANNVAAKMLEWGYDGVDFDFEFPGRDSTPAEFTEFFRMIKDAVRAVKSDALVMFGIGPGWWLAEYQWAELGALADYGFYFCYDWSNPQRGPVTKPGAPYNINGGGQLKEASCRGGIDYMIGQGFPAEKVVVGLPFSSVGGSLYRNAPSAVLNGIPEGNSLEVNIGTDWWTNSAAITMKTNAFLDPTQSVLCSLPDGDCSGGAVAAGVGFWHFGQENYESGADLSTAMRNAVDALK